MSSGRKTTKKLYDNRSPQKRLEEKAIMTELLKQTNSLTNDLQNFSDNVRQLLKDAPIPVHFNDDRGMVVALSKAAARFFRLEEEEIIGKPFWNFKSITENHKVSPNHIAKFLKSQEAIAKLLEQRKPLPDTHAATKFGEETECYIVHFHREYVYDKEGRWKGGLIFSPVEEITYEQFILLEQQDSLVVEEKAFSLSKSLRKIPKTKTGTYKKTKKLQAIDNRSPQKRLEERAIMMALLEQANSLTNDIQSFPENVRKLLKDAPIPTHLNIGKGAEAIVAAFSKKSEEFFRINEREIVGKPVWHFKSLSGKHKISTEHRDKFWKSNAACTKLTEQGKPLPITHVATKFAEEAECYIAHFHREYVYDKDGEILGHLVFVPIEEITYEQFSLLEQQDSLVDSLVVDEFSGIIELSASVGTGKGSTNVDQELDEIEMEAKQLLRELGIE